MNYKIHYDILINRARQRTVSLYTENHHIVPVCMGGTNDPSNLVDLLPEEHYVAHQLLVKIYPLNTSLIHAAVMMCVSGKTNIGRSKNKLYGWLKRKHAIAVSERQTGSNNSQFGTCWIYNIQLRLTKKVDKNNLQEYLISGWKPGRIINFSTMIFCCICNNEIVGKYKKTCNIECHRKDIKNNSKFSLLGREIEFIELYKKYKSMNCALKEMGCKGAVSGYYTWASLLIKNSGSGLTE